LVEFLNELLITIANYQLLITINYSNLNGSLIQVKIKLLVKFLNEATILIVNCQLNLSLFPQKSPYNYPKGFGDNGSIPHQVHVFHNL